MATTIATSTNVSSIASVVSISNVTHQVSSGDYSEHLVVLVDDAQVTQTQGPEHPVRALYVHAYKES